MTSNAGMVHALLRSMNNTASNAKQLQWIPVTRDQISDVMRHRSSPLVVAAAAPAHNTLAADLPSRAWKPCRACGLGGNSHDSLSGHLYVR